MVVWRKSLIRSQRYEMFLWTNNKDPTSDKGNWLFGTEWEAQCSTRGCPSLTEPFSTFGTDIKAALLYWSTHTCIHTKTCMHTCLHTGLYTHTMQEVCLSRTRRERRQQNSFLSTGIRKKKKKLKGGPHKRASERQRHSARQNLSFCRREICKGDTTIWALSLSSWTQNRVDRLAESEMRAMETVININRETGRFKDVWDIGVDTNLT